MPRDSTDTKTRLLNHAEKMFAEDGVFAVTNRQITEAAGQKMNQHLIIISEHAMNSSLHCSAVVEEN